MRKDLFTSLTAKAAIGVAAVLLTAGTGGAVVFSNINDSSTPPHSDKASDTAVTNAGADHSTDANNESADNNSDQNANNDVGGNTNDNHGATVSTAAQSSDDHGCANHGQYVSSVARGTTCNTTTGQNGTHGPNANANTNATADTHGDESADNESDDSDANENQVTNDTKSSDHENESDNSSTNSTSND